MLTVCHCVAVELYVALAPLIGSAVVHHFQGQRAWWQTHPGLLLPTTEPHARRRIDYHGLRAKSRYTAADTSRLRLNPLQGRWTRWRIAITCSRERFLAGSPDG